MNQKAWTWSDAADLFKGLAACAAVGAIGTLTICWKFDVDLGWQIVFALFGVSGGLLFGYFGHLLLAPDDSHVSWMGSRKADIVVVIALLVIFSGVLLLTYVYWVLSSFGMD
jgi:hypothetical protein